MVMTTHTIEEAEVLCDRLGILVRGKFMALGTPEELRKYLLIFIIIKKIYIRLYSLSEVG